jgi:anaphase-promoting complex subunit 2
MFDIVAQWPNSNGGLNDLRTAITTPHRRLRLTDVFSTILNDQLLHPGTSTLQILRTYISMIRSFHVLDQSNVLLSRVAFPLQLYLCSREDTVRIIIVGLLSAIVDEQGDPVKPGGDKLVELALLLNEGSEIGRADDEELDWHDLEWVPDPADAGPGYKRSKRADIIGTLIRVLGSQDVFIKEFQNIIGEHLLKQDGGFEKEVGLFAAFIRPFESFTGLVRFVDLEVQSRGQPLVNHSEPMNDSNTSFTCLTLIYMQIKVLDLLKARFGEAPLQSCEVMLKDVQDSGRVNAIIRRNQNLDLNDQEFEAARGAPEDNPEGPPKPLLHAKILSRLFWPQLHDETYRIPDDVAELQKCYEQGFESLKSSRKLTWLHALGQATVELEMEDRMVVEEVHTWQATVIWAFESDELDTSAQRSVGELVTSLEMDEALVRSALKFWTNKLVLQEVSKDTFAVLETLNQEERSRSNAQATAGPSKSIDEDKSLTINEGITTEKMQMYWQFIQGMLTNSSSQMPLQQIAMVLKMLIVDGFPYSNEELQEFLGWKVQNGELEVTGGKYKLRK